MDLAYSVLKTWKYEDVDYYEHFIYAVLSQLEDLHDTYRNRIMMDVADLYILHGDYGLGDADYGYILRETKSKIISIIVMLLFMKVWIKTRRNKSQTKLYNL